MSQTGEDGVKRPEEVIQQENVLLDLKMAKSRAKAAHTRAKNKLKDSLAEETLDIDLCREQLDKVEETMDNAVEVIHKLAKELNIANKPGDREKVLLEIEWIESQYEQLIESYNQEMERHRLSDSKSVVSDNEPSETRQIGKDLWKQLKRVSIPVFNGDKVKYPAWKAAFYSCIDEAPSTPEFKLLQLRQYLSGEALSCIDNLGHSAAAYSAAKERLERKFGGAKRVITRFLDELESFSPIRNESAKEIERFSDLLDIAVINLKEANHTEDLLDGSLYHRLLKKLPQSMLTRYNRKVDEQRLKESVETLRDFVNSEAEYAIRANETIHGLSSAVTDSATCKSRGKSYFVKPGSDRSSKVEKACRICNETQV